VLVDDELRLALSLYAPTGTMAFGGADTQSYNVIGDTTTNMSHSLASDDDLYIEGDLEVDGSAWFDASVTVAGTFTSASSKFIVDTNGDIVKLKNLTYSFPSSHTANGVLTNNGSGTLTWATVGASSITDDSLDFAQFEDTLDLDANLTLNQTAYTWAQTYTGTAGAGFTYTASGALTSGNSAFDLNISNASATIPAMMITNAGSSYALRINDDGTTTDTTPFVVDASGNVGIGDTNADAKLDIMASQTSGILQQISYESAATLAGNLIGLDLDLYTNVTPSTYNVTGINLELPTGASGDMTFLKFLEGSSTLYDFDVTSAQFNVPASFNNAGDVSLAYDLIFTNNSAAYLTFNGPGYVRTDDPAGNYDLTLLAANSGAIVVNDFLEVSDSTASTALAIINQTGGGPILDIEQNGTSKLYITNGGNVGIGVTAAGSLLHIATDTTALGQTVFEQASADSDAWDLNFRKARGTVASPTVITTGDELGAINFRGYSGAGGYVTGAAIKAISEGTVATTRVPANLSFWTGTDAVPSVLTERMRIDKAGNIGIGTTSPDAQLEVYGSSNKLRLSYNDTYYTDLSTTSAGNLAINTVGGTIDIDDGVLDFATQTVDITLNNAVDALNFDSNTLSIDASNNYVGIGTAAPVSLLSLSSSTASPILTLTNASDTTTYDPTINFRTGATPAVRQSIWLDDSDSDKLKFGLTGATYPALTIGTDGYFLSQIPDNSTTAFEIKEATNSYLTFDTTNDAEKIVVGKNLEVGTLKVDANSGAVNFIDMDITGTDPAGTTQSLSVALDGNVVATFYGEANGAGVLQNPRFGVGVTEPNYKLDVLQVSTTGPSYAANFFNDGDTSPYHGLRVQAGADDASGTTYYLDAYDGNGGSVGYLANVAGTFDVTDVSDVSTKTNIENTSLSGLNIINGLRVVDFNRSQNPDGPVIHGFVAQEVQAVFPEMVSEGLDGLLGLQKSLLIPVLVKAVQEQQTGFDLKIEGLESGLGNQELGIAELESRIGDLESGIGNQESRIGNLENKTTVADGSGEQADLESLQGALQTLVNSLSNLENVSSELDNLGASILTVMENSEVNAARIDELEQETKNLNQIVKVVEDAVVIGDLNKFIVLDSATGLEIKSANFSLDRDGNVIASGEIKTKIGRISSETGILELNPGEANDTVPNPKVVIAGDLEIQGKIILGAASQKDGEEETQDQPEADATTGKAKILAGETAIVIANNNVTENSLIYITPTSKTGGQVLYLDGQRAEDETNPDDPEETLPRGFTVAIEKAVEEELEFNWFVVDSH